MRTLEMCVQEVRLEAGPHRPFNLEVFLDRHCAEHLAAFGDQDETARRFGVSRQARHVLALEDDTSAPRRYCADKRLERRGLARAVGAHKGGKPAARGREYQIPQAMTASPGPTAAGIG
jgi:hypothetical protein